MDKNKIKVVADLLSLEFYRFKRYKTPTCLILVEIEDALFSELVKHVIRKTDLFQQIEKNFFAIVYTHTDLDAARNAFFNIFNELNEQSEISRLAITQVLPSDTCEEDVIKRVYEELINPEGPLIFA